MHQTQLLMKRRNLEGLEKPVLPKGYVLRTYQEGDAAHWARIISQAFRTECTPSVFRREIEGQQPFRAERVFFLLYQGEPIGTATAWSKRELGPQSGYVHMVAVVPHHSGKGLGKALTAAVLASLKKQGFTSAFLHTDDHRLAAIKTYLELGFEPVVESEDVRQRWVEVFRGLKRPHLSHRYCREE